MKRPLFSLLLLVPLLAWADGPDVRVRSTLEPAESVLVGGTLNLQVDVLVDTWFTDAPQMPKLDLDGAVVSEPNGEATHLTEQVDGKTIFGLRYRYQITPQRAQTFLIPALAIRVQPGQGSGPVVVKSEARRFTAREPSGSEGSDATRLVAQKLEFTQALQRSHELLRVGDSITRHLRVQAEGAQAMLIPPPAFAEIDGLKRYPQTPSVAPLSDGRGGVSGGKREDAVTYVASRAGDFHLPAVDLQWWDATSGEAHTASVPAVDVEVAAAATYQAPFPISEDLRALGRKTQLHIATHWPLTLLVLALLGALLYVGHNWGQVLLAWAKAWRAARRQAWLASSACAWRQVRPQLSANPPEMGALYLWLRRISGCRELSTVGGRLPVSLRNHLLVFVRSRYGREPRGRADAELLSTLPSIRRAIARASRSSSTAKGLKPLNP
ncbi:hypothetical protein [Pseudomonas knackmussii]|uniref:hypothetical protein n=1 Tax=Pseudomonas knackmussii TaxID=65741 RepID=UPI003F4A6160